jgi:hypothetical protein
LAALDKLKPGEFTDFKKLYHFAEIDEDHWAGVIGDGENAAYEFFVWTPHSFSKSEVGYGDSLYAFRKVLRQEII